MNEIITAERGILRMAIDKNEASEAVIAAAREVVRHEGEGLIHAADHIDETFLQTVRLLRQTTGKVFVTGAGTSSAIARRMAHLLSVSGTPSMFVHPADALHGTMGALERGDVLMAISKGGASQEINELVVKAKERGVDAVVALTSQTGSDLAKNADVVVELKNLPGIDPGEAIAMGSTLVAAAWGDALATVLMRMSGYSWGKVLHSHPSGAVGKMNDLPDELEPLAPFWN